jgi:hypothetical protein
MWEFYTPKIQILEFFPYTDEGWEEANLVEKRLIKPDLNNPFCLNENCGGFISLACARKGAEKMNKKIHEAKDENGKSLHSLEISKNLHEAKDENGKSLHTLNLHREKDENGKSLHALNIHKEKDENGKSLHALEMNKKLHEAKDGNGKSLQGLKNSDRLHEAKDEDGKSLQGIENAKRLHDQIWESTIDGFRSNAGNVARHNRANGWDPNARIRVG